MPATTAWGIEGDYTIRPTFAQVATVRAGVGLPHAGEGKGIHLCGTGGTQGSSGGAKRCACGDDVVQQEKMLPLHRFDDLVNAARLDLTLTPTKDALVGIAPLHERIAQRHTGKGGYIARDRLHVVEATPLVRASRGRHEDDGIGVREQAAIALGCHGLGMLRGIGEKFGQQRRQTTLATVFVGADDAWQRPLERGHR